MDGRLFDGLVKGIVGALCVVAIIASAIGALIAWLVMR